MHAIPADVSADCRRGNETTGDVDEILRPCITTDDIKSHLSWRAIRPHHGAINPRTRNLRHYCAPPHARTHARTRSRHFCPSSLCRSEAPDVFVDVSLSNQRCCSAAVHLPGDKCVFRVIRDGFGPVSRLLHMKQLI